MSTLLEVAGWLGAALLLLAYALVSYGRVGGRSVLYQTLNIAASILLGANTAWHHAWPSAFVNVVWIVIAIGALSTAAASRRVTPQEP
ncbi:MAG TPA: hypothetical protein VFA39_16950 [Steroidobacteraceae bacterium]|nr:hypothetical protein [Steroidobacteraceae bacterium]